MRVAMLVFLLLATGCASTSAPDPKIECAGGSRSNYTSGMGGSSCGAPMPCYALTEAERKTVPRCQRWEDKPLYERILLHLIYMQ